MPHAVLLSGDTELLWQFRQSLCKPPNLSATDSNPSRGASYRMMSQGMAFFFWVFNINYHIDTTSQRFAFLQELHTDWELFFFHV